MSNNKNSKSNQIYKPTIPPGNVEFRLLCPSRVAGGVIGHAGGIIKNLERETSAKIRVDDVVLSSCKERLIHVIGGSTVNRKVRVANLEVPVSAAQEGLIRVFDRMLEVGLPEVDGGKVTCQLLVGPGLVGAVMGAGGKRIEKTSKESGGKIVIFAPNELVLPCAGFNDELIEISGGSLAVKKALLAISRYIQQKTLQITEANGASANLRPSMKMEIGDAANNDIVNKREVAEVVFKLLCTWEAAGAVIGFRGRRVKALEEETGASILLSAPDDISVERVITISGFENRKSKHSSAQNALVRVFNGLMSSGENASARLLIQPSQSGHLNVLRDSITSCIPKATGATLQILEPNYTHAGASTDDKIIQIDGEYASVQIALFQVSWMLRECVFDSISAKNNSPLLPHKLFNLPQCLNETAALTKNMKDCRVTEKSNGSVPSNALQSELSSGHSHSASIKHSRDLTTVTGDSEHSSINRSVIVTNSKMEISVRADVFSSVFGDDGSNLSRLRTEQKLKCRIIAWRVIGRFIMAAR
ncbi:KH domain-containing protein HEN4-like isoform X2 [Chenopodium quinoa]|uniref:KH domain-containing protein HEN4-like isoform X2 n=1 Tax=Chenopodium quinoa TaxID=63459 RepID=UPI000B7780EA|nr:KH domain-containing protein HEN4-like isoform X2 [Chenopodium quinoa]